jgi:hypothetical protein
MFIFSFSAHSEHYYYHNAINHLNSIHHHNWTKNNKGKFRRVAAAAVLIGNVFLRKQAKILPLLLLQLLLLQPLLLQLQLR